MTTRSSPPLFEPPLAAADELAAAFHEATRCRQDVVASYSTDRIVAALANAASDWLSPKEPIRLLAIDEVALATGFDRDMVATGLDFIFSAVTPDGLRRLAVDDGEQGPPVIFHSLAGNVPGQGVPAIARSLLNRSIAIVRDSARQPVITAAFRETLRRYEPTLAAMVLPVIWSHRTGDRTLERVVSEVADRVELYGSDRTIADISSRYRSGGRATCELHGARVSAGLVLDRADIVHAARAFAVDVAMYEGRGCLTPHVILVEGDVARASELVDALARELAVCEERWPRARGSIDEEIDRRRFIDDAEVRALAATRGGSERCIVGASSAWCVRQSDDATITLGPGLRCVRVTHAADRAAFLALLQSVATPLAAVGVAGVTRHDGTGHIDDAALDSLLRAAGATLVSPAGRMQAPPIDWRPNGHTPQGGHAGGSR